MLRIIGYLFTAGFMVFLAAVAVATYVIWRASDGLPDYRQLAEYEPPVMTRIHAADGRLLAEYARERRLYVPIDSIPDNVVHAFLSAEDKNFYSHPGIDFSAVLRAVIENVESLVYNRNRLVGASTITQQVAKNFLLSSEQTFERKLKEFLLARRIEQAFSKDKILELYLNEIYLGFGSYGVAAAALNYFGKSLRELEVHEVAYLAALPKAPNNYHPFRHTERAIERRNWVISRMQENGYVTEAQAVEARAKPLEVDVRQVGAQLFAAESFAEEVRREVAELFGEKKLYEGGLSVRTTLDPRLQVLARQALARGLVRFDRERGYRGPVTRVSTDGDWGIPLSKIDSPSDLEPWRLAVVLAVSDTEAKVGLRPREVNGQLETARETGRITLKYMSWAREARKDGSVGPEVTAVSDVLSVGDVVYVAPSEEQGVFHLTQVPEVEGALVALDPHTGRVRALVGGFSYGKSQFNRAVQALRQPGSAFKPFVYAAALDNGYTPASVILDAPIEIEQRGGPTWRPKNYGGKFYGPSTLRLGIEKSRNVMTVRLAQDMGMKTVVEYAKRFGIYENMLPVLAMSLGAGETTLLKLTAAFGMIANGGKHIEPTLIDRIQDRYGRTVWRHDKRECGACEAESWHNQPEPDLPDVRAQVLDPMTAYQMTSMLEGVVQRGTATVVRTEGRSLAGKTGTTNDEKDAWFVGFSPDLAVGVFVGYDNPRPMGHGETGGKIAAPIFADFMRQALKDKSPVPFRVPRGIQFIPIDMSTGKRAPLGEEGVILEAFKPGEGPADELYVIGQESSFSEAPMPRGGLMTGTGGLY